MLLDERRGPIRLLTLNRPAQRNALSPQLIGALRAALADADRDQASRVVCVTGAGERAFCAGADLTTVAAATAFAGHEGRRAYAGLLGDLARAVEQLAGPDRPFTEALSRPGTSLIAEYKRRSPSAGSLREDASVTQIVRAYEHDKVRKKS